MAHLSHYRERDRGSDSEAAGAGQEDEVSSTSSDRLYEQDIAILNRCFDDIEKFIARLQHAAAASRELERRRRSRKTKSKSSDSAGEGMLALRTRPPPERDFRDVLQKFKLSFNLLARLRAHIHDPNAPELVHFLFTPLALIVDASHDASPDGKLAARVVQPLLTREALNLLANCVTSKETELWHSLGDAWLIPREQWKGSVPPYQPVFMDGWTPDYTVEDQALQRTSPRRTDVPPSSYHQPYIPEDQDAYGDQYGGPPFARNNKAQRNSADSESVGSSPEREIPSRRAPPPVQMHLQNKDMSLDSVDQGGVLGDDERESGSLNGWIRSAQARGARLVTVTYPRTANNDKELTVHRGEILEVLDDTRKWWKARNRQGMTAHVPHTIVAPYQPSAANAPQADVFNNPVYAPHYQDNAPRRSDAGSPLSGTGSYDSESTEINSPLSNSPMVFENGPFGKVSSELEVKSALAPPPPPPPHSPLWKTLPSAGKNGMSTGKSVRSLGLDDMQQELKMVLSMYNEKKKKIDIKKTPDLFIQQSSTEPEVQNWLEVKGFDEAVRNKLLPLNGAKLFALNKIQLQALVGRQDGKRLYSQILVQRNVSGYKTTTSSELNSILKKVREKVEVQS